jgi:hypothetical protein
MRKKLALAFVTLLAVGAVATTASATGPIDSDEGFACLIFDQNGALVLADTSFAVWYASGKTYLRCEGWVGNDTGARIETSGFLCNIPFSGLTTDSKSSIGRNGLSQLTCVGHADPTAPAAAAASGQAGAAG